MVSAFYTHIDDTLTSIVNEGLYKSERLITSKQASGITVSENGASLEVINFCANNYLGLADSQALIKAGKAALETHGCLLYTSPSPRDATLSRMPSSA